MPVHPDDDARIQYFLDDLATLGLEVNVHYRLLDPRPGLPWRIEWLRPCTVEQFNEAEEVLEGTLNG